MKQYNPTSQSEPKYNYNYLTTIINQISHDSVFVERNYYPGKLGAIYSKDKTEFKLWAPTASQVEILIYDGHYGVLKENIVMAWSKDDKIFTHTIEGDNHGLTYRYRLTFFDGRVNTSNDPYARAVTVNGQRSVVVDLDRTNPDNWGERMPKMDDISKAVIYELHLRDFTVDSDSGVTHKGKFLGAIEENATNPNGSSTGIDYLKELGVTHVEFLPLFDYQTVDETVEKPREYNWGYDPQNYGAPEGSYSTNPYDPFTRIKEMKQMIQAFHDAGLRVIMDVVYNHVYEVDDHSFHLTVPGYFFRYNDVGQFTNGTGVGNDTASERYMMRKYIVDSVSYWAKEYQIDGFRFDLMGIHDTTTMNTVRKALDEIDPSILLFGEGWDLYTPLSENMVANHNNAVLMPRVGQFNDGLREALKGNDFEATARGFINGAWHMEQQVAQNVLAGVDFGSYNDPQQVIQYVEAHDNFTLYDKLRAADPDLDENTITKRHELATTIILLSQGIPFIHAGQEFLRTKNGVRDSYNKPDTINKLDWLRQDEYRESVELVKNLIKLRNQEPLFHLSTYEEIKERIEVTRADYQIVQLTYRGDGYKLFVTFNAQGNMLNVPVKKGEYIKKVNNRRVYLDDDNLTREIDNILIDSYTTLVLKKFD
ncbi:type I pullulanase [Ruoffia tabacinasalis]|uniref:type I pullulanase n=1 Tax=Ruoffia tabacinasalis TaxID=87458 RepID=UPI0030CCD832